MRVLFISANEWEPWGGSEELWSRAAAILRARGAEIVVSVKWFGQEVGRIRELRNAGCRIHYRRQPFKRPRLHLAAQRTRALAGLDYFRHADLVVISQGMNWDGLPWMQMCASRRLKYVVIAQAAAESTWIADRDARALARAYEQAAHAFFVSNANLELTRKQLASQLGHCSVVRNPFNISYDGTVPWPSISVTDELRLACIGRLDPRSKGQDLIIDVLRMPHWRDRAVTCSIVGKGLAEQGLRRLAASYNLGSVRFSGAATDISVVWRAHHALLLPSRFEGLPLVIVEAMLAGRPVITTNVGGNAEVVTDGETGYIAAAPTVAHVDEVLSRAWQERARLPEMGQRAATRIRQLVPSNPEHTFANALTSIVGKSSV